MEDYEQIENILIRDLTFLSGDMKKMNECLFSVLDRKVNDSRFFFNEVAIKSIFRDAVNQLKGTTNNDDVVIDIIKRSVKSPFGIFDKVLAQNVSDIFIVGDRISFTHNNSENAVEIVIPKSLIETYSTMVDNFIRMTLYSSNLKTTKFNPKDAVLDYTSANMRFNVVNGVLNASLTNRPIISIRKQIVKTDHSSLDPNYILNLGINNDQVAYLNWLAANGSYCIFGETGSGKTTLLKYMGAYQIENKRNLITIEDTPELFLPVNIAYLTNDNYKIHDLFKVALRENPSHMIVGETRSEEIVDILESGLVFRVGTSIHADSFAKAIMRIVFMVKASKANYSSDDINALVTSTMDGFIYMKDRKIVGIWKRKPIEECDLDNAIKNFVRV